ncbi:translocation/assembly module TamB domain-containing protein [Deinococcus sonorensis]|uniref:Translocation/assembly module TamB domain-containing protein n=2 Tax=Deinococcus sonorensis TaxID=309891 RepID=A0AAU7U9C3_9DEIO
MNPRRIVFFALAALVVLLSLFGPSLFGQALLSRIGGDWTVQARSVGGPLWAPVLRGVTVRGPGTQARADLGRLHLASLNPFLRTARVDLTLHDATVDLRLSELLRPQGGGGGGGLTLLPGRLDLQNVQLNVNGQGYNVPNGHWTGRSLAAQNGMDGLELRGTTDDGALNAVARYRVVQGQLQGTATLDADATLLNAYWHNREGGAVQSGHIRGQYTFGQGAVRGDLKLNGGSLRVPQAGFVTVTDLSGQATQRGSKLTVQLNGRSWNGPVSAQGGLDLDARHWELTAQARPQLDALAQALGQTGKGQLLLQARAQGWSDVRVDASVSSPEGQFSVLPYQGLKADYVFLNKHGEERNALSFQTRTSFQGQQTLSGVWNFNQSGQLRWTGELLSKPLALAADIDADNVIAFRGQGLGGPVQGQYGLSSRAVSLDLTPDLYSVRGHLTASGTVNDLRLQVQDGQAGPFALAGSGRYDRSGLSADLGAVQLNLDRQLRGRWQARGLSTAGVSLSGSGQLQVPDSRLTGTLSAQVPLLDQTPSGPIALNWSRRQAEWTFAGGQFGWQGDTFTLKSSGLSASGFDLRGQLALTTALKATGTVTATSRSGRITARGLGDRVAIEAVQNGVRVQATTRLAPGYATTAQVVGTDIRGSVDLNDGVRFSLSTAGQTAQGTLQGQDWTVTGGVNLASLRPLVGGDLRGTARLNFRGQGGRADVNASGFGADISGTLTRQAGVLSSDLRLSAAGAVATLRGQLNPALDLRGPVTYQGQTLQAHVYGPYGQLQASVNGQTQPITVAGLTVPGQALSLQGTLTPGPAIRGTFGGLQLSYDQGRVRVQGTQPVSGYGQSGQLTVNAQYAPGFQGQVSARGALGPYAVQVNGPWTALATRLTGPGGLRASGTVSAPDQRYDLTVRGPLAGLYLQGRIQGQGTRPHGTLQLSDAAGGSATVRLNGLDNLTVQAGQLTVAGQTLSGTLTARNGLPSGTLTAGPLTVQAVNGQISARGTLAGHTVRASGRLRLPAQVSGLTLSVDGPLLSARANGDAARLTGSVTLKRQSAGVATLPAQTYPLQASITPLAVQVGGLGYAGGQWNGSARVGYQLSGQTGQLRLIGAGSTLSARPSGPVSGQVTLLPALGGQLQADLSPLRTLLPAQLQDVARLGRLQATLHPQSADLSLSGARYLDEPLGLSAAASWTSGLNVSGVLTHPGSRIPVQYQDGTLSVRQATLDAHALKPVLAASGQLRLDLTLPDLQLQRASGAATVNLTSSGQTARGQVRLSGGQLSADLNSTLGGQALTLRGPLYPRADARLTLDDLSATLRGDVRQQLNLAVNGAYQGRAVALTGTAGLKPAQASLTGTVAGLSLNLLAQDQAGWRLSGSFSSADLTALTGTAGQLSGTLNGPLDDLSLNAAGRVAGVEFTLPARYRSGALTLLGATAAVSQLKAQLSGQVYPALRLSGAATVTEYLPGRYALSVGGGYTKPDVRLNGRTTGGPQGLDAAGSTLTARLLGRDWRVTATGERLAGSARGVLGGSAPAGLMQARFTVNAPYHSGATTLQLQGLTGWSTTAGWLGLLKVGGEAAGQPLSAELRGNGVLQAQASLGVARLTATLPADLPYRPGGSVSLQRLDLGALWGRPSQLQLTSTAELGGTSWQRLSAQLNGQLTDAAGDLSGNLTASVQGGNATLALHGARLQADARLQDGQVLATLNSQPVTLARLLPTSAGVSSLRLSGQASASGTTSGGLSRLQLSGLNLSGVQTQLGDFSLSGSGSYTPDTLQADLQGTLLGGTVVASGQLPAGLKVAVAGLQGQGLERLGLDAADGTLQLSGPAQNPILAGTFTLARPEVRATVHLNGPARDPILNAGADLRGDYAGRLMLEARHLSLQAPYADLRLTGTAAQGQNTVRLDLAGRWPALKGRATAQLAALPDPLQLDGDGLGGYTLDAGTLGNGQLTLTGLNPSVSGRLHLTPLPLLGATGEASLDLTASGPLLNPLLSVQGRVAQAERSGVRVSGLGLSLSGTATTLNGTLTQGGQTVGQLQRQQLTLNGLAAQLPGVSAQASGRVTLSGTGSGTVQLNGSGVQASLKAAYAGGSIALSGTGTVAGFTADLNSTGSLHNGWTGQLNVSGGPAGVLTEPARLKLDGAIVQPQLSGSLGLVGAGVRMAASPLGVQLRLTDGPGARASGVLNLNLQKNLWSGQASLTRPEGSLAVQLSGQVGQPQAQLELRRGGWQASGTAAPGGVDLNVTDGLTAGRVRWNGSQLGVNLPGLQLDRLQLADLAGRLTASGTVNTRTLDGALSLQLQDGRSGYTLPVVNLPVEGSLTGSVQLSAGRVRAEAALQAPYGSVTFNANQGETRTTGALSARLTQGQGTLNADARLDADGLTGGVTVQQFPLTVAGLSPTLDGTVSLDGQRFVLNASATTSTAGGETGVDLSGSGGLADLLPQLTSLGGVQPTGEGYAVRASLGGLELSGLKVAPYLKGAVSGEASISDGGGTFVLRSGALTVGNTTLAARVEGTQVGGDWRLRGSLGSTQAATSTLVGALSGGVVSGTVQMRGLPADALIAAFSGPLPGQGLLTGIVRFRAPMSDPLSGDATVVAERLSVTGGMLDTQSQKPLTQTLTGSGVIRYANRELTSVDLHLSGAGRWDVTGAYTHRAVGVTANFQNTTFTPVLSLIPGIREQAPSLQGSLTVQVGGSYERPVGRLNASNLQGSVSGLSVQVPTLNAQLLDTGAFSADGRVLTGGTFGANGSITARGTLASLKLSGLTATYQGLLVPPSLGRIDNLSATLSQTADGYAVRAQAIGGSNVGSAVVSGELSPAINLSLTTRNFNLPVSLIFARESRINADLKVVQQGEASDAPINVSGQVTLGSLLLGQAAPGSGSGPSVLPAPGQSSGAAAAGSATGDVNYVSPLPEELTVFPETEAQQAASRAASPLLARLHFLNIPLRAPNGIRVDETLARAELGGALTLSGSGADPRLSGDIHALRGSVDLRDNEFALNTATATFDGTGVYPVLAVNATGDVPLNTGGLIGVQLTLDGRFVRQSGGASTLTLETHLTCTRNCTNAGSDYSANNPAAEAQLYALVALGTPDLTTLPSNLGNLGTSAIRTALNVFVLGEFQRNVAQALGLDVFRISADLPGENGSTTFGAKLTVGSYLTRQLYLQYQVDLTGQGLIDATYTTPDNRLTFKASTPIQGLNLTSLQPSFSAAYNVTGRSSVQIGVQSGNSTRVSFGYVYRW